MKLETGYATTARYGLVTSNETMLERMSPVCTVSLLENQRHVSDDRQLLGLGLLLLLIILNLPPKGKS